MSDKFKAAVKFSSSVDSRYYCLTKISIRAKRSISRVFSLFIVPSPFFVHCPCKGCINGDKSRINLDLWLLSRFLRMKTKNWNFSQAINFLLTGLRIYTGESKACGPYNALPSVGHYVGPWGFGFVRIDQSTVWSFLHPVVTYWSIMAVRVQIDQTKQRKLNREYWNPWQMQPLLTCWYSHPQNNFL